MVVSIVLAAIDTSPITMFIAGAAAEVGRQAGAPLPSLRTVNT